MLNVSKSNSTSKIFDLEVLCAKQPTTAGIFFGAARNGRTVRLLDIWY
jgi:hypothetical protein